MNDLGDIIAEAITPLIDAIVEHDRRLGATDWRGKVTDVDAAKKLARIEIGKNSDGDVIKSPWLPYSQTAGALKVHSPPSVGQTMTIRGSTGDIEQGALEPFHWSDDNQSPSDSEDERVLTFGSVRAALTADGIHITGKFRVTGDVDFDGGHVTSNGKKIDDTHKHINVEPGLGVSGIPE
jgi:phage baseplate assembly protein gpV